MGRRGLDLEDLYRIVLVSNPLIHPSGDTIVFTVSRYNRATGKLESSLWAAAGQAGPRPLTGGTSDTCPVWGPGGIVFYTRRDEKQASIMAVDLGGGEPWKLAGFPLNATPIGWNGKLESLVVLYSDTGRKGEWKPPSERDVLTYEGVLPVWFNGAGLLAGVRRRLGIIGYPDGSLEPLSAGDEWVTGAAVDPSTGRIAYTYYTDPLEPYKQTLAVVDPSTGEKERIVEGQSFAGVAWSHRSNAIAYRARSWEEDRIYGHYHVYYYELDGGEPVCLSCTLDRNTLPSVNSDVRGPSCLQLLDIGPEGNVYFPVHDAGSVALYRASPETAPEPVIPAGQAVVDEFTVSKEGGLRIAYTLMTAVRPKEVMIRDDTGSERITWFNDWIETRGLREPSKYTIEGYQGDPVDFWVLPPVGQGEGEAPWILYIHGGPKTSYGYGFMFEFHVYSSKGYAVVYGNPHGSDGYSRDYALLSAGRLGTADYEDLMRIADTAPSVFPGLNPEGSAVAGGSYGGWMTAYIITRTDRFRAAIVQRGCSNWASFYGASDIGWYFAPALLDAGAPWEDPSRYEEMSPLYAAGNIRTPTLIIHSLEDYRCPVDQALQLYTALTVRRVPSRLALFPGENHDLSRTGSARRRIARLKEMLGWLDKYLACGAQSNP